MTSCATQRRNRRKLPGPIPSKALVALNYHLHPTILVQSGKRFVYRPVERDTMPYGEQDCPGQFRARSPKQRAKHRARNGRK